MVALQRAIDKKIGRWLIKTVSPNRDPKRFLIIKLWAIGDSVVLLPMIEGLRKAYPDAQIDVLCRNRNKAVFEDQDFIDNILLLEPLGLWKILSTSRYDVVIDAEPYLNISALIADWIGKIKIGFSHGVRSRLYDFTSDFSREQHMVKNYCGLLKTMNIDYDPENLVELKYPHTTTLKVERMFGWPQDYKSKLIIGICPGVAESVKARQWPIENFVKLTNLLINKLNAKIVVVGNMKDRPLLHHILLNVDNPREVVDAVGKYNLKHIFKLIKRCDAFISNDTGPMHIAAAQGVKTVGLFGPNTPTLWAPYGKNNISIYAPPKSGPFINNMFGYMPDKLTREQANCMNKITVDRVFKSVKRLLNGV